MTLSGLIDSRQAVRVSLHRSRKPEEPSDRLHLSSGGRGLRLRASPTKSERLSATLAQRKSPTATPRLPQESILKPLEDETFRVIIVRPGDVIGVGSIPWVTRPLDLMRRHLFALPNGGRGRFNPIHVRDVARGLLHLSRLETPLQSYNLVSGISVSCAEYFGNLARTFGLRPPIKSPGNSSSINSITHDKKCRFARIQNTLQSRRCRFFAPNGNL